MRAQRGEQVELERTVTLESFRLYSFCCFCISFRNLWTYLPSIIEKLNISFPKFVLNEMKNEKKIAWAHSAAEYARAHSANSEPVRRIRSAFGKRKLIRQTRGYIERNRKENYKYSTYLREKNRAYSAQCEPIRLLNKLCRDKIALLNTLELIRRMELIRRKKIDFTKVGGELIRQKSELALNALTRCCWMSSFRKYWEKFGCDGNRG